MTLEVLPQALLTMKNVSPVLSDGSSLILFKQLHENLLNKEIYLSSSIVVYLKSGRQVIHDYDGISERVEENNLIFLGKGIYTVSDFIPLNGAFKAILFCLEDRLISKYLASIADGFSTASKTSAQRGRGTYTINANEQIKRFMTSLGDVYGSLGQTPALIELKLLELLHLIAIQDKSYRFIQELIAGQKKYMKRRSITDFMERYALQNLTLDDYALLTGRSVSSFVRDFKRIYNTTPNKWILDKKVQLAHRLMLENNYSVTDAAMKSGFENVSHFIKMYKRKYGLTPKQLKANHESVEREGIVLI